MKWKCWKEDYETLIAAGCKCPHECCKEEEE